jgi:hypothetical protein
MASKPFEIIAAPFVVWWAPTGSTFPDLNVTPPSPWAKVGTSGARNYSEDGVVVVHGQTIEEFRTLGSTGPVKANRTEESLIIRFTLLDLLLEQYRLALNNNSVTTIAAGSGTAGVKDVDLWRGLDVTMMALLARGDVSPEGNDWKSQYQIPWCFQSAEPEPTFQKGAMAGLALEFTAVEDPDAASAAVRFGKLVVQNADAV